MKPIIGISYRIDEVLNEVYVYSTEDVRKCVVKEGGIPFLLLNQSEDSVDIKKDTVTKEEKENLYKLYDLCDGFVLCGGTGWFLEDEILIDYCKKRKKPILGICLGMQEMSKMLDNEPNGADITVKNIDDKHNQKGVDEVHKITIKNNTLLYKIVGKNSLIVNSRHNYHVTNIKDKYISAVSDDNIIEAVELPHHPFFLGVQWHPENLPNNPSMMKLFTELIENSKQ